MAHELDYTTGEAAFAHVNEQAWHKEGKKLEVGAPIEEWQVAAGMDWHIKETPVKFVDHHGNLMSVSDKKVLYRSDTGDSLSVVGDQYKVVQPKEVLEFFRDLISDTDMYLDTAGCLKKGTIFWANANTSKVDYIGKPNDIIKGNLFLMTGCTGTISTSASFVGCRVVCMNTMRIANAEETTRVRVTHRQDFDMDMVKRRLGLFDSAWGEYIENLNKLASKQVSDSTVHELYKELVYVDKANPTPQAVNQVNLLMNLYKNGKGAEMTYGNLYGALNGVTEAVDWHSRNRSEDSKIMNKFYGKGAELKQEAFDLLLELA